MFERFSEAARSTVTRGVDEARLRGDRRVGTDHLLLGLVHDKRMAEILGTDLSAARAADTRLDGAALRAIGLDVDPAGPWARISIGTHTPFTAGARDTMRGVLAHTVREHARRIEPRHLLLAILDRRQPDPALALLTELGVDRSRVLATLETPPAA